MRKFENDKNGKERKIQDAGGKMQKPDAGYTTRGVGDAGCKRMMQDPVCKDLIQDAGGMAQRATGKENL